MQLMWYLMNWLILLEYIDSRKDKRIRSFSCTDLRKREKNLMWLFFPPYESIHLQNAQEEESSHKIFRWQKTFHTDIPAGTSLVRRSPTVTMLPKQSAKES